MCRVRIMAPRWGPNAAEYVPISESGKGLNLRSMIAEEQASKRNGAAVQHSEKERVDG